MRMAKVQRLYRTVWTMDKHASDGRNGGGAEKVGPYSLGTWTVWANELLFSAA